MKTSTKTAVKPFLKFAEFAREVGLTTGAVDYWARTGQVKIVEAETPGASGPKKRKRIPRSEVKRVRDNLDRGLPAGFGMKADSV